MDCDTFRKLADEGWTKMTRAERVASMTHEEECESCRAFIEDLLKDIPEVEEDCEEAYNLLQEDLEDPEVHDKFRSSYMTRKLKEVSRKVPLYEVNPGDNIFIPDRKGTHDWPKVAKVVPGQWKSSLLVSFVGGLCYDLHRSIELYKIDPTKELKED